MLARRAKNNTFADFITAAVEIRGFGLVGDRSDDVGGEMEDLFCVSNESAENLPFPSLEPFPFQLGNFFDQFLHAAILFDGLANAAGSPVLYAMVV